MAVKPWELELEEEVLLPQEVDFKAEGEVLLAQGRSPSRREEVLLAHRSRAELEKVLLVR